MKWHSRKQHEDSQPNTASNDTDFIEIDVHDLSLANIPGQNTSTETNTGKSPLPKSAQESTQSSRKTSKKARAKAANKNLDKAPAKNLSKHSNKASSKTSAKNPKPGPEQGSEQIPAPKSTQSSYPKSVKSSAKSSRRNRSRNPNKASAPNLIQGPSKAPAPNPTQNPTKPPAKIEAKETGIWARLPSRQSKAVSTEISPASKSIQEQSERAREDRIFLQSKHGMRAKLRHLREQMEPIIDAKLAKHQGLSHKIDVMLRGGKPRTFALVGSSGTGKSFRALLFAENQNIPYLIDDGILIKDGKIIAGRSAKNESVYIKAIKTALFDDAEHLQEVRDAIKRHKVQRILLVGTSVRMVSVIAGRLGLSELAASDITYIEEISNPEEIAQAKKSRNAGHHIIPVPALELSRAYSNLIRDSFEVFLSDIGMGVKHYLKNKFKHTKSQKIFEKTVVQPPFMKTKNGTEQKGKIQITESALQQIIIHCIDEYDREVNVTRMKIRLAQNSHKVTVYVTLPLKIVQGKELNDFLYKLRNYVVHSLHRYAGLSLGELNIKVSNFV